MQNPKANDDSEKSVKCDETWVKCNGGHPTQGHPAVFLDLSKEGRVACPYCGLVYSYCQT